MRRLVSCHHLTCVGKDGGREEAEGVNTWKTKCESLNGDAGCDQRGSERPERTQPLLLCIISTVHHFKRLAAQIITEMVKEITKQDMKGKQSTGDLN